MRNVLTRQWELFAGKVLTGENVNAWPLDFCWEFWMCVFVLKSEIVTWFLMELMNYNGCRDKSMKSVKKRCKLGHWRKTFGFYVLWEDYKQEIIINGIGPSPIISFYWLFKSYIKDSVVIHPSETFRSAGKIWILPLK